METEYAWAAGFWDGEGCVSLTFRGPSNTPRVVAQVAQVDREVLDKFSRIMGVGNVLGPYPARHENSQPYFCWRVEGAPHLRQIRDKLCQYLGSIKLEQIDNALQVRKNWEESACCEKGHRLSLSPRGHWRCEPCQSERGKANAAARWARQKDR